MSIMKERRIGQRRYAEMELGIGDMHTYLDGKTLYVATPVTATSELFLTV